MSQTKNPASPTAQAMTPAASQSASGSPTTPRPKGLPLYKIYELPAPIRTFPLPSFYPNNPISLFHVLFAWTKQTLFPPPAEPSIVHEGIWSPESKSVNITDEKSMRALWEQGFYGKGNLSRSEPNWLKRERVRRGLVPGHVSELVTASRREERRQMKWERAKSEQEAIRQLRLREAQLATQLATDDTVKPSTLAAEAEEFSPKLPSNHVPAREASTDAGSLPEPTFPLSKSGPAANGIQADVPEISQDAHRVTLVAEPEVLDLSVEDDAPAAKKTADGPVNGVSSHVTSSTITRHSQAHIGSAKIAKPIDFLQSRGEVEVTVESEIVLRPGDVLPTSVPLTWAPVGPAELLSLPNSHASMAKVEDTEGVSESVDVVIDRDVTLKPGDTILATIPPSLSAPVGPLEILRLPNSHIRLATTTDQVAKAVVNGHFEAVGNGQLESADAKTVLENGASQHPVANGYHASSVVGTVSPVGPLELLSLPNAYIPLVNGMSVEAPETVDTSPTGSSPTVPQKLSTIHEGVCFSDSESKGRAGTGHLINDLVNSDKAAHLNGLNGIAKSAVASTEIPSTPKSAKRRKSVRFSPKVESTTYELSDPPSPSLALFNGINGKATPPANGTSLGPGVLETETKDVTKSDSKPLDTLTEVEAESIEIVNKEHLQLTSEEAFFLTFGMGALRVVHPATKLPISTSDLFKLFRSYSYFPSRAAEELQPDDGFLVNYAVYHHFRSLGWVPRAGIKFGVDWMLYARGPVFDHAEFGAIILPSYSDQWWKDSDRQLPRKTWHWLHGVVRVLSHVQKSLVLVYVDVPPPPQFDEAMKKGPAEVFKLYKIREVMVKRWSSNRNR
ncbi:putative tRNA-splicing endonuclease subunit tsp-4 [Colletotrichum spaethianum]|uniref:tRNA-intron lyase n=1 Tax=Colletotrichum spaethianum TaxID=700344 RepID=A0AA37L333_9PEZI|nr:putative tRNA-splicing endonuclease subunit tsp-4 [Colletotrichum spaethianum]GKT41068.1 putative tRNA-splicing endonuclease subunit tsp-4 [Colletotrichum spaethianum]